MRFASFLVLCLSALSLVSAVPQRGSRQQDDSDGKQVSMSATGRTGQATAAPETGVNNNANAQVNDQALALNTENVQTASQSDGEANAAAGQSPSDTDDANFINFCTGKTLTNGIQNTGGSCNGIVMGEIPSKNNMISSLITFPGPGDDIQANTEFNIQVKVTNLVAGTFTNPDNTYYAAPQKLQGGRVVGHTHVTVQSLGNSIKAANPPDPATFAFFKGINDDGDGQGGLSAAVAGGLPAGAYRVCTMTSASNHQPVLMPVAQRGAQDDCTKFTVGLGGGADDANDDNNGRNANANPNVSNDDNNNVVSRTTAPASTASTVSTATTVATAATTTTTSSASRSSAATGGNGRNNNNNGNNQSSTTATTTATAAAAATTTSTRGNRGRNQGQRRSQFVSRDLGF